MQLTEQQMIDLFKKDYPDTVYRKFSDEGFKLLLDYIKQRDTVDKTEATFNTAHLYEDYHEESCKEFIEFYKISVEFDVDQNKIARQMLIQQKIKEYLDLRTAFVGFTTENRIVYCSALAG